MSKPETKPKNRIVKLPYVPHEGQRLFHEDKARFRIMCTGRKWGKTTMLVHEAFRWLGRPNSLVWWVAPYYNLAQLGRRRFMQAIPEFAIKRENKKDFMIEMVNGSTLWFKSADSPDSLVGEGIDFVIIDEAARVRERVWQEAIRPNLSDPGRLGHACMASTPLGHNWFYRMWLRGMSNDPEFKSWGMPVVEIPVTKEKVVDTRGGYPSWSNPHFKMKELESALKTPKRVFLQEYVGRFLEDLGAVFQNITGAIGGRLEEPVPGEGYIIGVDLGKVDDFTVICVVNEAGHLVYFGRFNQKSWTVQVSEIIRVAKLYNNGTIFIDSTGLGDPVYDFIRVRYPGIMSVKLSSRSKREIIENLVIAIQSGHFTYPDIPELIEELSLFGAANTPSGNIRYEAPDGFHDDCVIAAALAIWGNVSVRAKQISFEWVDM